MKQENNSTFNEGLVSDLNELSTPNNLLTDCVNGTLVTFDGNEFSLQNDMGNAKILIPGKTDQYVKLKEGFYPIGVKEYGGVLYIVSAKKPTEPALYDPEKTDYSAGTFVKDSLFYYKCLQQFDEIHTLPTKTNEYWEVIGSLEDYNNYLGEVEIGSFPHPQFAEAVNTQNVKELTISNLLYTQTIINDEIFKSGRYITFNDDTFTDKSGFSYYNASTGYTPVFYKLKLWHQLTNGFYDLTNDIWEKYIKFHEGNSTDVTGKFWINTPTFKYYCPYQYKGKLAVSVEIETSTFELNGDPQVTPIYVNGIIDSYDIKIDAHATTKGVILIGSVTFTLYTEDGIAISGKSSTVNENNGDFTYTFNLSAATYQDSLIRFKLTPNFSTIDIQLYPYSFPTTYTNSYIIESSVYLEKGWSVLIRPFPNAYICDYTTKWAYITKLVLTDLNGHYVDVTGNSSDIPYVFVANDCHSPDYNIGAYTQSSVNDTSDDDTERIIATYTWTTNQSSPNRQYNNANIAPPSNLLTNFDNINIANVDTLKCGSALLTINLNHPLEITTSIGERLVDQLVVSQIIGESTITYDATYSNSDLSKFMYTIDIGYPYTVDINPVYDSTTSVETETYFEPTSQSGVIKPFYPIHYNGIKPTSTSVTNNFALISRLEGDYGIIRTDTVNPKIQMIGFHFNTFLYSGYANPGVITYPSGDKFQSPLFSVNYNNGTSDVLLENKSITWISDTEQYGSKSFLEYKFRDVVETSVDYQLINKNGNCISISSSGGSNNKLLSETTILADNITSRANYYVIPVGYYDNNSSFKVITYIFAKDYVLGTPTKVGTDTTHYTLTESGTDFVGNPVFIRKRLELASPATSITISGETSINENTFATYSIESGTFTGVLEWIVDGVTIIEYPTSTSVKVRANNIATEDETIPGFISVLDSLGNRGYLSITINNIA